MANKNYVVGEVCKSLAERRNLAMRNGEPPADFLSRNGPFIPEISYTRELFLNRYGKAEVVEELFHAESSNIVIAYLSIEKKRSGRHAESVVIDNGTNRFCAYRWADADYPHPLVNCRVSGEGSTRPDIFDIGEQDLKRYVKTWLPKLAIDEKILRMKRTG